MKVRVSPGLRSSLNAGMLIAVSVGLILFSPRAVDSTAMLASSPIVPIQWALYNGIGRVSLAMSAPFARSAGDEESVHELRNRVESLETQLARSELLLREAQEKLENLVGERAALPQPVAAADIIGADPSGWRSSLIVDKGRTAGVRVGMIAYWDGAVVGRVSAVGPFAARIRLVTDPASGLGVRSARSRVLGVLEGPGGDLCRMKYVGYADDVVEGDLIVTSGTDGLFPPNLVVGVCEVSRAAGGELMRDVLVSPAISPRKLQSVIIGAWTPPDAQFDEFDDD